jgi:hypothetical protein
MLVQWFAKRGKTRRAKLAAHAYEVIAVNSRFLSPVLAVRSVCGKATLYTEKPTEMVRAGEHSKRCKTCEKKVKEDV